MPIPDRSVRESTAYACSVHGCDAPGVVVVKRQLTFVVAFYGYCENHRPLDGKEGVQREA